MRKLKWPVKMVGYIAPTMRMNLTKSVESRVDKIISNQQKSFNLKKKLFTNILHMMLTFFL